MKKVLLVAHCGPDTFRIARVLNELGADYDGAFNHQGAIEMMKKNQYHLVLPNRVFGYDEEGGINFIKTVKEDMSLKDVPVMLVSGFSDYQERAVAAGAVAGFGKDELETGGAGKKMAAFI